MPRTPYNNFEAYSYAKAWCSKESNSCGVFLSGDKKSDCAHFISHALAAGGIVIKAPADTAHFCPSGLAVRNVDLVARLRELAAKFDNVKEIPLTDGIVGDVGFLELNRPTHTFMVCEPDNFSSPFSVPKVWAHSSSRCCEELGTGWRQWFSTAFRLEDG